MYLKPTNTSQIILFVVEVNELLKILQWHIFGLQNQSDPLFYQALLLICLDS